MESTNKTQYKLIELIDGLDATIKGDPNCLIHGISTIQHSKPGQITFIINALYKKYLPTTQASAVILDAAHVAACPVNAIVSSNPHFIYAKIAAFFSSPPAIVPGIHSTVVTGANTDIHASASIRANCVIGKQVKIAANVLIGPGCTIGDFVEIAEDSRLDANVNIYHHVKIGKRVCMGSGVVIGSDGFSFAQHQGAWHKIPQLGSVEIGDDVDIGANTTIDCGAIENTVIESGVKLDNLIQIGHNVKIGANTIIAGCVGIAGSTIVGKNCMVGGASCLAGHITICDNVMITGMASVTKSIVEPGIYSSGLVGAVPNHEFRKNNARFYRLENLMQRVKKLESILKKIYQ